MSELNWNAWHRRYEQPGSSISRRLEVVQRLLRSELDHRTSGEIVVLSICAGQAHDLLGVLTDHPRAVDVTARLVEYDATNCRQLEDRLSATGLSGIEVLCTDAGLPSAYEGWPPADIVLVCGLFGNIDDADIERTIAFLPTVCAEGALVIWTRNRTPPDRTPKVRRWFDEHGFDECHFKVIPDSTQAVGAHRLGVDSAEAEPVDRIFTFIGYDKLQE